MPYQVEETGEHSRLAQVTVPLEDYNKHFNRALRTLSKRVKLPGFRKGKIPLSVMRRNYGNSVRQDVIEQLLNEHISQLLDEAERVIFLAQPEVTKLPTAKEPMEFKIAFELRPQVDPIGYFGVEVGRPDTTASDEALEERLDALRLEHARLEPIELRDEIREGDIVELDFRALGDDEALEQLAGEGVQIKVGSGEALEGIEEALEGAKFGETLTTTLQLAADFPVEELRDRDVELELAIKSVKQQVLPELDDEFAVDTGLGQTLIELRSTLRAEIERDLNHRARHIAEDNLLDALLEQNPIELPPMFVESQIDQALARDFKRMTNQDIDPRYMRSEQFEPMREQVRDQLERQIKAEFLLMAIAEKEELKVEDADLDAYFEHQAQHVGVDPAIYANYMRADRDRLQQAAGSALIEKVLLMLLDKATIKEIEWPTEDEEDAATSIGAEEE